MRRRNPRRRPETISAAALLAAAVILSASLLVAGSPPDAPPVDPAVAPYVPAGAAWKNLLPGPGMAGWREPTGDWQMVGQVVLDPADGKKLAVEPGVGTIYNGPKGRTRNLFTAEAFGDVVAHIEFMVPKDSNSGVYFMGRYEIQVFDSFGKTGAYPGIECGGIYQRWDPKRGKGQEGFEGHSPRVNASRPPGQWQTFDVVFRAPRFDAAGKKIANARFVKVVHNGTVVHENVEVTGPTRGAALGDEQASGPLMFQGDHGPVAYRRIAIIPIAGNDE